MAMETIETLRVTAYVGLFLWACVFLFCIFTVFWKYHVRRHHVPIDQADIVKYIKTFKKQAIVLGANVILFSILIIVLFLTNYYKDSDLIYLLISVEICFIIPAFFGTLSVIYFFYMWQRR
jgi:hypothetical protein